MTRKLSKITENYEDMKSESTMQAVAHMDTELDTQQISSINDSLKVVPNKRAKLARKVSHKVSGNGASAFMC